MWKTDHFPHGFFPAENVNFGKTNFTCFCPRPKKCFIKFPARSGSRRGSFLLVVAKVAEAVKTEKEVKMVKEVIKEVVPKELQAQEEGRLGKVEP